MKYMLTVCKVRLWISSHLTPAEGVAQHAIKGRR